MKTSKLITTCAWSAAVPDERPGGVRRSRSARPAAPAARSRRDVLQWAAALLLGCSLDPRSEAQTVGDVPAFAAGTLAEVLAALGGRPASDSRVVLEVPDLVENGAIVPVQVTSHLPGPQVIYMISESNPYPLVAAFDVPDGTEAFVGARIKVAESCNVFAVVRSGNELFWTSKGTRVTIGGCGE